MILLATSVLVDCLTGAKRLAPALRRALASAERVGVPALVLYEWFRGPRRSEELAAQEALLPSALSIPFGAAEAATSEQTFEFEERPGPRLPRRPSRLDLAQFIYLLNHSAIRYLIDTITSNPFLLFPLFIRPGVVDRE